MEISNDLPKISVITVTYNSERFLEGCIKSVIKQNYPNLEYIIIDAGSTDGTLDIIKKYEKYIDYWVSEPDKGPPDACNKGVKVATGDLINFLNSDDLYVENALFEIADKYQDMPQDVDIITCGVRIDYLDSKKMSRYHTDKRSLKFSLENILFNNMYISGFFFRRSMILKNKLTPLNKNGQIFLTNDTEFAIRTALQGYKNIVVPKPLQILQSSSESFTFSGKNSVRMKKELCDTALDFLEKTNDIKYEVLLKKFYYKSVVSLILIHMKNFNLRQASLLFFQEFKKDKKMWLPRFLMSVMYILQGKCRRCRQAFSSSFSDVL